jgi:photosystem II stability/assembly factor-like uncharacterized protein
VADRYDNDRLFDAALRTRHRDGATAAATSSCLDAETIAAWADRALSVSEARAVEIHLSNCPRCQEVAAVFTQSAPPPAEAAAPWWRLNMGWLMPALASAAAVVLVVWVTVLRNDQNPADAPATQAVAQNEATSTPQGGRSTAPAPGPERADRQLAQAEELARERQPARQTPPAADAKVAGQQKTVSDADLRDQAAQLARGARPVPPPPPAAPAPPAGAVPRPAVSAPPPPTEPPQRPVPLPTTPPAVTALPPAPVVTTGAADTRTAATPEFRAASMVVVAEFGVSSAPEGLAKQGQGAGGRSAGRGAGRGGGGAGVAGGVAARQETAATASRLRWRVLVSGVVEKSIDGGATWAAAAIQPPQPITGGAAPQPEVCWLIGRGGVVLRSTDGATFARVQFPDSGDLSAITATSALAATITTASGRSFTTTDGGKTWR